MPPYEWESPKQGNKSDQPTISSLSPPTEEYPCA